MVLSLANLRRWLVRAVAGDGRIYAVESPSLIAGASRAWTGSPLVCTSGRRTIAAVALLRLLASDGAVTCRPITCWLAQQAGSVSWRMTATNYLG